MFTLDVEMSAINDNVLYTQKNVVIADADIWHKRIGHVNIQQLKSMQSKNVVTGFPNFRIDDMQKVCEACQFGKHASHVFLQERNMSSNPLDVIHSDVWGPT